MLSRTLLVTTSLVVFTLAAHAEQTAPEPVSGTAPSQAQGQAVSPSLASPPAQVSAAPVQNNDPQLQAAAAQVIGDINVATVALMYGMNDDAATHIADARKALATFKDMASYNSSAPMEAGKMQYKTAQGIAEYWIPVASDHFVVRTLAGKHLGSRNPDIDVTDAQSVHYKLFLNTKMADEQLAKALNDISQKQYDTAMQDLQNVSQGSISEMTTDETPEEAARDNLVLSRELLADKDNRSASFALKHAGANLAQYEKENPGSTDRADVKDLQSQIYSEQAAIDRQNPSIFAKAEQKIESWFRK